MPLHEDAGPVPDPARDEPLRRRILQRLGDELLAEADAVDVDVVDGRVTLRGDVSGPDEVQRAAAVVRGVDGVEQIDNLLRPKRAAPTTH